MTPARKEVDTSTYSGRFAKRLRKLREESGYSVEEVVERIAKFNKSGRNSPSVRTYYGWEDGSGLAHIDLFPAIAKALKEKTVHEIMPAK